MRTPILSKPEISFDIRNFRVEAEYFAGGRTGGVPTGRGIDTVAGAAYATTVSNTTNPGFLSIVYPFSRFVHLVRERFPVRPAQMHASFGGGFTFFRRNVDANGAVDLSSKSRVLSVSAIVRFGR